MMASNGEFGYLTPPANYITDYSSFIQKQNLSVLPNDKLQLAINNIDRIYYNIKLLTDGRLALGTIGGNSALHLNKQLVIISKGDSIGFCDWFKHVMTRYGLKNYKSNKPYILDQPEIIVPKEILSPPPLNTSRIIYNATLGTVQPLTPEDAYLQNFKVDFDGLTKLSLKGTRSKSLGPNDIKFSKLTDNEVQNNITHGIHKMFADQVKPRALNSLQTLVHAVFSYRCETCAIESSPDCKCYLKSPEFSAISQFIQYGKGCPFFILATDAKTVKNSNYPYISSMIPFLWYVLCDLSLRTGSGAVTQSFAAATVRKWLISSTYSLLGSALYKFKKVDKLIPFIISQTNFEAIELSRDNTIVGTHPGKKIEKFDKKKYLEALEAADFLDVLPANLPVLDDQEGRLFINMIQYFKTLSAPLKTPISLSMDVSAQATMATSPMVLQTVEYANILDQQVPIKTIYEDEDMDWMRAKLLDLLHKYPPDLKRLESKFIEACTTNSAGVDPEKLKLIRDEIVRDYGNSPDVKEMSANAGVRIFDVLRVILKCCTSTDALLNEWMTTGMSGIRTQVGRRNRLIQMLASVFMFAPFLIKTVFDDIIANSDIAATGKTTGDIRDSYDILFASGRDIWCLFSDVAGMDTNTYTIQQRFLTETVAQYLSGFREIGYPYFLNKVDGQSMPIKVEKTQVLPGGVVRKYWDDVSVLEYFCILDSTLITERRRVSDGYFFFEIFASNITFPSGSYKTSTQHTMMLMLVYLRVRHKIETKYADYGLRLIAKVLGDDQFCYAITASKALDEKKIAEELQSMIDAILEKFSYKTDQGQGFCYGEFLKLVAYYGGPSPLGSRLPKYTSEDSSSYNKGPYARMQNICGVFDEDSARVPNPNFTKIAKRIAGMILSYITVRTNPKDLRAGTGYKHFTTKSYERRVGRITKLNPSIHKKFTVGSDKISNSIKWMNRFSETVILKIIPGGWYLIPAIGVQFYPIHTSHVYYPDCNWLAFSSPFTLKLMFDLCRKDDSDIDAIQRRNHKYIADHGLKRFLTTLNTLNRRAISIYIRKNGIDSVQAILLADHRKVPINSLDIVRPDLLHYYGFSEGYFLKKALALQLAEFTPGPLFKNVQRFGNSFLDNVKVSSSLLAAYQLRTKYHFSISDSVVYSNRVGARLEDAVQRKNDTTSLTLAMYTAIDSQVDDKTIPRSLADDLVYGDFSILTNDIPYGSMSMHSTYLNTGFGSAVPPKSMQALFIDIFGLPKIDGSSFDAIRENVKSSILIDGAADDVVRTLALVYKKYGSAALNLAYDAIGIASHLRIKINKMFTELGYEIFSFPYAMNPRKEAYYNLTRSGIPSRLFTQFKSSMSSAMQEAFYLATVCAQPMYLAKQVRIVPNTLLTSGLQ